MAPTTTGATTGAMETPVDGYTSDASSNAVTGLNEGRHGHQCSRVDDSTKPLARGREAEPPAQQRENEEPFAQGREADLFALPGGRVLRRYRWDADTTVEAQVMTHVRMQGYPVPQVYAASGRQLVLEHLDGLTLANGLWPGRLGVDDGAAMLADLLRQLHGLPRPAPRRAAASCTSICTRRTSW